MFVNRAFCEFLSFPPFGRYTYGLPPCERFLINATVGQNAPEVIKVLLTTAFSSTFFDLPYIWVYGVCSGLLSGLYESVDEAVEKCSATLISNWKSGLKVWPGFTFLCMFFLPRDLVVPAGNFIGYFCKFLLLSCCSVVLLSCCPVVLLSCCPAVLLSCYCF